MSNLEQIAKETLPSEMHYSHYKDSGTRIFKCELNDLEAFAKRLQEGEAVAVGFYNTITGELANVLDSDKHDIDNFVDVYTHPPASQTRIAELEAKLAKYENTVRTDNSAVIAKLQASNKKLVDALTHIRDSTYRNAIVLRGIADKAIAEAEEK